MKAEEYLEKKQEWQGYCPKCKIAMNINKDEDEFVCHRCDSKFPCDKAGTYEERWSIPEADAQEAVRMKEQEMLDKFRKGLL